MLVAFIQVVQYTAPTCSGDEQRSSRRSSPRWSAGCLLTGGYGSAIGAALGALIFAMVQQGIVITGVDGDWYQVVLGAVLVAAVIFNNFIRRRAAESMSATRTTPLL